MKSNIYFLTSTSLILFFIILQPALSQIPSGDVAPVGNQDGIVNVGDSLVALRFALGLDKPTQMDMKNGDVAPLDVNGQPDPDGQITVGDALVILRKALGLVSWLENEDIDNDGDGYNEKEGDFDDSDPYVNPGALEICDDGIDNDCDGVADCDDYECTNDLACIICTDSDSDGYYAETGCGTAVDCNDNNQNIHPGAIEICGDWVDQDCNGGDLACISKVVLFGNINVTSDYSGDIKLLGELKNTGNKTASFVKIKFTFYDYNSNVIDQDFTYVDGSCMTLWSINIETDTVLKPNEVGAFKLYTFTKANSVSSYSYTISFDSDSLVSPDANLVVYGSITESRDYSDDLKLLGTVKNTGTTGLMFGKISFAIKNSAGLIIDTAFSYIDGENVYLPSIDTYTDTALDVSNAGTFEVFTDANYYQSRNYYYKASWDDVNITHNGSKNVFFDRSLKKFNSIKLEKSKFVNERDYQTKKQRRKNRDLYIDSLKDKMQEFK